MCKAAGLPPGAGQGVSWVLRRRVAAEVPAARVRQIPARPSPPGVVLCRPVLALLPSGGRPVAALAPLAPEAERGARGCYTAPSTARVREGHA